MKNKDFAAAWVYGKFIWQWIIIQQINQSKVAPLQTVQQERRKGYFFVKKANS